MARIKLLGGLKIDEHLKPQDGRFRYQVGTDSIDVRVAIIPVFYGEKIELRLLPSAQKPLALGELGMLEDTIKIVEENAKKLTEWFWFADRPATARVPLFIPF